MTGSDRLPNNTETQLRAPYAAPRSNGASGSGVTSGRGDDRRITDVLVPFVPREFRHVLSRDVTVVPAAELGTPTSLFTAPPHALESTAIATFENNFSAIVEEKVVAPQAITELPWIDAFAAAEQEPEDAWPMGEAGKRLDELTQSLTSLDASRARQQAEGEVPPPSSTEAEHEMWSEEEWIDIMPTPLALSSSTEVLEDISNFEPAAETDLRHAETAVPFGAESAARALEGLAQRVRAGQLQVPAFNAEMAEEAMLAGLLASMLGWRQ